MNRKWPQTFEEIILLIRQIMIPTALLTLTCCQLQFFNYNTDLTWCAFLLDTNIFSVCVSPSKPISCNYLLIVYHHLHSHTLQHISPPPHQDITFLHESAVKPIFDSQFSHCQMVFIIIFLSLFGQNQPSGHRWYC